MTTAEVIQIIQSEKKCMSRRCYKKSCKGCELFVPKDKILEAHDIALKALLKQTKIKAEFFKSGIEFAKQEFIRTLEREKLNVGDRHKEKMISDLDYMQVLGLQKAIELSEEVRLDEGIKENLRESG